MKLINITVIIKNGGYEQLRITPKLLGELALSIQDRGSEIVQLQDRSIIVVGFLKVSKEVRERIIVYGDIGTEVTL